MICPVCRMFRDSTGKCGCTSAPPNYEPEPYEPPVVPISVGWQCPVCRAVNSPDTKQCPCSQRTWTSDRTYV